MSSNEAVEQIGKMLKQQMDVANPHITLAYYDALITNLNTLVIPAIQEYNINGDQGILDI